MPVGTVLLLGGVKGGYRPLLPLLALTRNQFGFQVVNAPLQGATSTDSVR